MKVRELYSDESKWVQRKFRADQYGISLSSAGRFHPLVQRRCLHEAIQFCYGDPDQPGYNPIQADPDLKAKLEGLFSEISSKEQKYLEQYTPELQTATIAAAILVWNDRPERTFAEVKELVDRYDI